MSAREALPARMLSISVRESRMFVERILLTCRLPSGCVHGIRECVLLSEGLGLGGLRHLLECHAALRMDRFGDLRVEEIAPSALEVDGAGLHAWLLLPTVTDLAVDVARRHGRSTVTMKNLASPGELAVAAALATRHGAVAAVAGGRIETHNGPRPHGLQQWDPVLHHAVRHGFEVEEGLWREVHRLANTALAPDSVLSRRHAGPVVLRDDGSIQGRLPQDDDFDINMLKKVPPTP